MKEPIFIQVIWFSWRVTLQQGAAVSQGAAAASYTPPSTAVKIITPARHPEQPSAFYMMPGGNLRSEMDLEHLREKPGGWEAIQRQNNRGMRAHRLTPPSLLRSLSVSPPPAETSRHMDHILVAARIHLVETFCGLSLILWHINSKKRPV